MRIAMLTNNYKPYMGGVPIAVEYLAEALRKQGHTVYVFAPTYENQAEEEYVIRYPSFPAKVAGAPIPNVLTKVFGKEIRELGIEVIHVHHPALVGNIALMLRRKYGIPVVYTYHTRFEQYLHYVRSLQWVEARTRAVERYMDYFNSRCDLILTPTPGMKEYLESGGLTTPVGILPTGIRRRNFRPDERKAAQIRSACGGNADYFFCTVARLAKEKNLDFQLRGLKLLKENLEGRGKTFRHMVIGEGPERERLLGRAQELGLSGNLVLAGKVPNEDIPDYLRAADAFLFSSKSETQGIVILEAMAAGVPIVAVRASGVEDIVMDGENGFLTAEKEAEWAGRILAVMEDGKVRERVRENAERTAGQYTEEIIAKRAAAYYRTARRNYGLAECEIWENAN